MSVIQEYKCPCCGGAIAFDAGTQKLKCPYCDTEFDVEMLNELAETADIIAGEDTMENWDTGMNGEWNENESAGMRSYICNSCGGEIIGDENMGASSCPFCGSPIVVSDRFSGILKPDLVIPFKLDKKAAKEALQKHLDGKKLLPKVFKSQNHIDEIKGIYVPFWLFDADVSGSVKYSATRTRCWSTGKYNYTETKHFAIYREGDVAFKNIPVDASSKMADDLMDSLEPFNFDEAVDFNTAYFAGYFADKYDVTVEENLPRINFRVKHSTEDAFRQTITGLYDTVLLDNSYIDLHNGGARYALLPVWLLNTTWNGEKYTFAMNGQTGKFVGNLPMDKKLYRKYWWRAAACSVPFGLIIGYLLNVLFR